MLPDTGSWRRLDVDTLAGLPEVSAVFEVATLVRTVLYIGGAEGNLRQRLGALLHDSGRLPPAAGGYWVRWELASTATEGDLLEQRLAAFRGARGGQLPPGNRATRQPAATPLRPSRSRRAA